MIFSERRAQLAFLYGNIGAMRGRELKRAEQEIEILLDHPLDTSMIFDYCPFNDSFETVSCLLDSQKRSNPKIFQEYCFDMIREYFILYCEAECKSGWYGNGRLAYGLSHEDNTIILLCDWCGDIHSLDQKPYPVNSYQHLNKNDFKTRFGDTERDWPDLKRLVALQACGTT